MTTKQILKTYCEKCAHRDKCHTLCVTVLIAIYDIEDGEE